MKIAFVARFLAWWQRTTKLSSLGTELVGGSLAGSFGLLVAHVAFKDDPSWAFAVANLVSFVYEIVFDPNGFEWKDVGQREIGIVLMLVLR